MHSIHVDWTLGERSSLLHTEASPSPDLMYVAKWGVVCRRWKSSYRACRPYKYNSASHSERSCPAIMEDELYSSSQKCTLTSCSYILRDIITYKMTGTDKATLRKWCVFNRGMTRPCQRFWDDHSVKYKVSHAKLTTWWHFQNAVICHVCNIHRSGINLVLEESRPRYTSAYLPTEPTAFTTHPARSDDAPDIYCKVLHVQVQNTSSVTRAEEKRNPHMHFKKQYAVKTFFFGSLGQ